MEMPEVNLDQIALQTVQPVQAFLSPSLLDVDKAEWKSSYELVSMGLPDVVDIPTMKRKLKIQIGVKDNETQKTFSKTIFFGEDDDYCFSKDKSKRLTKLTGLKHIKNILHSDYWRGQICFSGDDWIENSLRLARHFLKHRANLLKRLKPKSDFTNHIKKRQETLKAKQKNAFK